MRDDIRLRIKLRQPRKKFGCEGGFPGIHSFAGIEGGEYEIYIVKPKCRWLCLTRTLAVDTCAAPTHLALQAKRGFVGLMCTLELKIDLMNQAQLEPGFDRTLYIASFAQQFDRASVILDRLFVRILQA